MEKFRITALETLNIPAGNDVALLVKLVKELAQGAEQAEPFPVDVAEDVAVSLVSERGVATPVSFTVGEGGRLLFTLRAADVRVGLKYGIDVKGTLNDVAWHAYGKSLVSVTAATERGPQQVTAQGDPYEITLVVGRATDVFPKHISELLNDAGYAKRTEVENFLANYIPTTQKGKANGVASLDAAGKILAAALNMPWRGNFTGNFQASNVEPGIYGVDDRKIGPNPLNGENAHGVMLVFPDRYKTTLFLVGRPNGSQYGTAPEIYARRWLETANSWTSWFTTANYAKRDEIPTVPEYTLAKSGSNIQLKKNGEVVGQVTDDNTTYTNMTQAEADTGTATTARSISANVLKAAIEKHTEGKATIDFVNSSIQTATATFRGTHESLEELQAVEGADQNDYGYVVETDVAGNTIVHRYKYVEGTGWQWEYDLNNSGFTAAEWAAMRSGMTAALREKLEGLQNYDDTAILRLIGNIEEQLSQKLDTDVFDFEFSDEVTDYSVGNYVPSVSSSSGKWGLAITNKHGYMEVSPGEQYIIESVGAGWYGKTCYAFLSEYSESAAGGDMPLVEETDTVLLPDYNHTLVTIPEGCTHLVFGAKNDSKLVAKIYRYRSRSLGDYVKKTDLPSLQTVAASQDNIEVAAGSRVNVQVPLDIPEGYAVGAYKGIGLTSATDDADGFKSCAIQSFSTAGGGTKANISIKCFGDAAVKVKLSVEVLLFKN